MRWPVGRGERRTRRRRSSAPTRRAGEVPRQRTGRIVRVARRLAVPVMLIAATAVVLGVGVLPTRTYLDKRSELGQAEARLAGLQRANDEAQARADLLDSDAEIERLARRDFGLALPGEETYVVLPPPREPVEVPDGWPFDKLELRLEIGG